jgi:hypothetical protein
MPLLRQGVIMPVEGIDFSKPATFISPKGGFPVNMRYYRGEMRKRPGKSLVGGTVADATAIMGLGKLETNSLIKYVVRASHKKLEKYNSSTLAWESISNTDFYGGDSDFFSFAQVTESNLLIITNFLDRIRKWSGSGNAALLLGNPPKAKYATYLSPYLLLAYVDDGSAINPWRVDWCDTDDPENWSTGNSGSALLSREPSVIQNNVKLNEGVVGYKKESLWLGRMVETSDIFVFDCVKTGIGLGAPRAYADVKGQHFFMSLNDFHVFNGAAEQSIGGPVRDEVFAKLNRGKIDRCFAVHVQELEEVWFFIVISGEDWPTEIWKYNYRNGFWYYDTCSALSSALKYERVSGLSWDDDTPGTWDQASDIWDSGIVTESWEDILFGDKDGKTLKLDYLTTDDNAVAVSARLETKDFIGDALESNQRWLQIDLWARGPGKLYLDYSIDEGSNWVNIPYSSSVVYADMDSIYTQYHFYFDVLAPQIRFRMRNAVSGEVFFIRNFCPYYLSKEQRR